MSSLSTQVRGPLGAKARNYHYALPGFLLSAVLCSSSACASIISHPKNIQVGNRQKFLKHDKLDTVPIDQRTPVDDTADRTYTAQSISNRTHSAHTPNFSLPKKPAILQPRSKSTGRPFPASHLHFAAASDYMRKLNQSTNFELFRHRRDYEQWMERPDWLPANPDRVYRKFGWENWWAFLGTEPEEVELDIKVDTQTEVDKLDTHNHGAKSQKNQNLSSEKCVSEFDVLIDNIIPTFGSSNGKRYGRMIGNKFTVTEEDFEKAKKWLHDYFRNYRRYSKSLPFADKNGTEFKNKSVRSWQAWAYRPKWLPSFPQKTFSKVGWTTWADWYGDGHVNDSSRFSGIELSRVGGKGKLGNDKTDDSKVVFGTEFRHQVGPRLLERAREYCQSLLRNLKTGEIDVKENLTRDQSGRIIIPKGFEKLLKTVKDFDRWSVIPESEGGRPKWIPSHPREVFKKVGLWKGFPDFLGTVEKRGTMSQQSEKCMAKVVAKCKDEVVKKSVAVKKNVVAAKKNLVVAEKTVVGGSGKGGMKIKRGSNTTATNGKRNTTKSTRVSSQPAARSVQPVVQAKEVEQPKKVVQPETGATKGNMQSSNDTNGISDWTFKSMLRGPGVLEIEHHPKAVEMQNAKRHPRAVEMEVGFLFHSFNKHYYSPNNPKELQEVSNEGSDRQKSERGLDVEECALNESGNCNSGRGNISGGNIKGRFGDSVVRMRETGRDKVVDFVALPIVDVVKPNHITEAGNKVGLANNIYISLDIADNGSRHDPPVQNTVLQDEKPLVLPDKVQKDVITPTNNNGPQMVGKPRMIRDLYDSDLISSDEDSLDKLKIEIRAAAAATKKYRMN